MSATNLLPELGGRIDAHQPTPRETRTWAIEIREGGPYLEAAGRGRTTWTMRPSFARRFASADAARLFIVETFTVEEQAEGMQPIDLEA